MSGETVSFTCMADDIRKIYGTDRAGVEHAIENYVDQRFKNSPASERTRLLVQLIDQFEVRRGGPSAQRAEHPESGDLFRLLSLVLGDKASTIDLSSPELMERVSVTLNTLFDSLNKIVKVINSTLLGERMETKTIRHFIGSELEGVDDLSSLQSYLNRIEQAFLIAYKAFQEAAEDKIREILSNLDPEKIAEQTPAGMRFGPLRKAALFDVYKESFRKCEASLQSGRLVEGFLREFEKNCQKTYTKGAGRVR